MKELPLIERYYGTRTAKRSGVPLINHIHEGLAVLEAGHDLVAEKHNTVPGS